MGGSRAILPTKPVVDTAKMRRAVTGALDTGAKEVQADFNRTTASWRHGVDFTVRTPQAWVRDIFTEDDIWQMLNAGTREHLILPKRGKMLAFGTPFRAKTVPQSLSSGPGSVGGNRVFSRGVIHPGTDARDWDLVVAVKWIDVFPSRMRDAIRSVL